jgi:hypothetical protein
LYLLKEIYIFCSELLSRVQATISRDWRFWMIDWLNDWEWVTAEIKRDRLIIYYDTDQSISTRLIHLFRQHAHVRHLFVVWLLGSVHATMNSFSMARLE